MDGYKPGTGGPNTGVKCWTVKDKATTYNNISAGNHTTAKGDTRAFTNPTPGGETTLTLTCGSSVVTTEGDDQEYGFAYEIIDSISDTCDEETVTLPLVHTLIMQLMEMLMMEQKEHLLLYKLMKQLPRQELMQ